MTPNMLRKLWSLVETAQPRLLLELDDGTLVTWLMEQMEIRSSPRETGLTETSILENYIREHILLIRDIASDSGPQPFALGS